MENALGYAFMRFSYSLSVSFLSNSLLSFFLGFRFKPGAPIGSERYNKRYEAGYKSA